MKVAQHARNSTRCLTSWLYRPKFLTRRRARGGNMQPESESEVQASLVAAVNSMMLLDALKEAVRGSPRLQLAAMVRDWEHAREYVLERDPDIVLFSATLSGLNDLSQIAELKTRCKKTRWVIFVRRYTSVDRLAPLMALEPSAVIGEDVHLSDVVKVLELVTRGMTIRSGGFPKDQMALAALGSRQAVGGSTLAPQESAVLRCLAQGFTEQQTSQMLGLGVRTIHTYLEARSQKVRHAQQSARRCRCHCHGARLC